MADRAARPRPSRTIPAHLSAPLLAWLRGQHDDGRPRTHRDAVGWMAEAHGVKVSRQAVTRVVASHAERADAIVTQALREELRDAVGPALDRLKRASRKLDAALGAEEDTKAIAIATRAQVATLSELAKLAGLSADEVTLKGSPQGLAEFLATAFHGRSDPSGPVGG